MSFLSPQVLFILLFLGLLPTAFAAPGDLDPTFGNGGIVITPDVGTSSVAIQSDGKIVVGGFSLTIRPYSDGFALLRYNSDGTLDPTFGTGGVVVTPFADDPAFISAIAIQSDGKIVAVGSLLDGLNSNSCLARYNSDGSLDLSFGINGQVITPASDGDDGFSAVVIQTDGKIIGVGSGRQPSLTGFVTDFMIARYNADGSLDSTYGTAGIVFSNFGGRHQFARGADIQSDGKVIAVGATNRAGGADFDFTVARYSSSGELDTTFGIGGITITSFSGTDDTPYAAALQSDGKIVLVGAAGVDVDGLYDVALARYNSNGDLDTSFSEDGKLTRPLGSGNDYARGVAIQSNGKINIGGFANFNGANDFVILRFNADGSNDNSFGTGGIVSTDLGSNDGIAAIAIQSDGKLVAAGGTSMSEGTAEIALVRYLSDLPAPQALFDYDADGKSDVSVFRLANGAWYLERSSAGPYGTLFGFGTDKIAPADYDGDGKTDIALYRPETGIWYAFNSGDGTVSYTGFGLPEDLPTPADYDGDGLADVSVFRPSTSTWYRQNSSDGSFYAIQFGASEDKPTIGDFDGDGHSDIAIFRPSLGAWYQLNSSNNQVTGEEFGFGTDVITPADFDGDGKTDLAVFRPSNGFWYIKNSNGPIYTAFPFGLSDDIPAAGDFDGDGRADLSVFRPSDGTWYRMNSSDGSFFAYPFGANGDRPTQTAFRY